MNGNGDLTYPIGLVTMPEVTLAGASIVNGNPFWTMTPYYHGVGSDAVYMYVVNSFGVIEGLYKQYPAGIRPSISLAPNITYHSGTGTKTDPYIIHAY